MKYTGKETTKKELLKKHANHVKDNDNCFATSDGNCFVGLKAKSLAYSHAALYRPNLNVFNLNEKGTKNDVEIEAETTEGEMTIDSLMKLSSKDLKEKADELGVDYESDSNKRTIANSILKN